MCEASHSCPEAAECVESRRCGEAGCPLWSELEALHSLRIFLCRLTCPAQCGAFTHQVVPSPPAPHAVSAFTLPLSLPLCVFQLRLPSGSRPQTIISESGGRKAQTFPLLRRFWKNQSLQIVGAFATGSHLGGLPSSSAVKS